MSLGCVSCASSDSLSRSVAKQEDLVGVSLSQSSWSDSTHSSADAAPSMAAWEERELLRNSNQVSFSLFFFWLSEHFPKSYSLPRLTIRR